MGAGFRGTFAIAWADSEIDGVGDAPPETLTIGASWCWNGRAMRIDGPQDVLVLERAVGAEDLRHRVARAAGRRVAADGAPEPEEPLGEGFSVTDGRQQFAVSVLRDPKGGLLLAFPGHLPAPLREHWVTAIAGGRVTPAGPDRAVCFAGGTMIRTPQGERPVEELRPGDLVCTRDSGACELLWTASRHVTGARLLVAPELRPVRIRAGALGGQPQRDLWVSPQHRLLRRGRAARALFGTEEVLVAAGDLIDGRGIAPARVSKGVSYHHLLFARHQVIWANGAAADSFHPAEAALDRIEPEARARLLRLIPGLFRDPWRYGPPARRLLSRGEAAILRHDPALA